MNAKAILAELKPLGAESYKRTMINHGIREPVYGVKIEDMKKIVKRLGKQYQLALDLYDSGVYDAMYMAGLLADDRKMKKKDLEHWLDGAYCSALCEYTVPWVASESNHGWELGQKWIEAKEESAASAGWATLVGIASTRPDEELDLKVYAKLLDRVGKTIHDQPDRVRYVMNGFVIGIGSYVKSLHEHAVRTAKTIGKVTVDMGDTACKVPLAVDHIKKFEARSPIGKKRKSPKC